MTTETTTPAITILGLGPGSWDDLTMQARAVLERAAREQTPVRFRTLVHPTVEPLKAAFPTLQISSFDDFYDESDNWEKLYQRITDSVCELAARQPVIYAVPGHPLIGELTVQLLLTQARQRELSTRIVAGLSFLEPVCTALELDPFTLGAQIIDATALAGLAHTEVAGKLIPTTPLLVVQVYNRRVASEVKIALGECYPDEWPVKLVRAAGVDSDEAVIEMPLYELDRNSLANHLCTLYVPPRSEMEALRLPESLRYITMRLRRDPDGCPWDREQTHESLTRYALEEAYEVVDAIEENDFDHLAEELGDLLLQVYLHAEIARQEGHFAIGDVFEHVNAKLIRRHPHVFGTTEVANAGQVVQNWEAIKKQEKIAAGKDVAAASVLDGVPLALPALMLAQEYQKRAAKTGFEFNTLQEVLDKLSEELSELRAAVTPEEQKDEMGDVLFIVAKLARMLHIDAEEALRQATRKFKGRFTQMEAIIKSEQREFVSYTLEEWMQLWERVKAAV
ncbi:MAG TPA: nucleoside triphosphate pyrophosphohydrolase [Ktedonobacteraceae bacterium]|nr:nucleoside triphosphate pyrophosphohydrolase [Ktedonobacteraceae bacterium]